MTEENCNTEQWADSAPSEGIAGKFNDFISFFKLLFNRIKQAFDKIFN